MLTQSVTKRALVDLIAFGEHITHQPNISRHIFARDHDRFANTRQASQLSFDLAEFNSVAADLHLVIETSQEVDASFFGPSRKVTCPVHARTIAITKRIRNESLLGQIRTLVIATNDTLPRNPQFTGHSNRQRLVMCVENIELGIRNRCPNRDRLGTAGYRLRRRPNRRLRRPVHIHDDSSCDVTKLRRKRYRERFAADHQMRNSPESSPCFRIRQQHSRVGRCALEMSDGMFFDLCREGMIRGRHIRGTRLDCIKRPFVHKLSHIIKRFECA